MRVLLCYRRGTQGPSSPFERLLPVGLCSLQVTPNSRGHRSMLANFSGVGRRGIERHLRDARPDLVGSFVFTFSRSASFDLVRIERSVVCGAPVGREARAAARGAWAGRA